MSASFRLWLMLGLALASCAEAGLDSARDPDGEDAITVVGTSTRCPSGSWSSGTVDYGSIYAPALAIDASGRQHVVYVFSDGRLRYATRAPGTSWIRSDLEPPNIEMLGPALAVDGGGDLHLVYSPGPGVLKYATKPAGGAWKISLLSDHVFRDHPWSLAADAGGTVHVAYFRPSDAYPWLPDLMYARHPKGGAWSTWKMYAAGAHAPERAVVATDSVGGVHLAYSRISEAGTHSVVEYRRASGGIWSSPFVVDDVGFMETGLAMTVDGHGWVHVVHGTADVGPTDESQLRIVTGIPFFGGMAFGAATVVDWAPGNYAPFKQISLAATADSAIELAYDDLPGVDVTRSTDGTFPMADVLAGSSPSLALDPRGTPFVAYRDSTGTRLGLAQRCP
jgi:hypothetical protein